MPNTVRRRRASHCERTRMPNIVVYTLVSLDGATEDPHRYFPETPDYVGPPVVDEELAEREEAMLARQGAVLLGRTTYDQWSRYWPTSQEQPFADFINGVRKYVVTSRPLTRVWGDSVAVIGPIVEFLVALKASQGGNIGIHGSIELAQSLLAA